MSITSPKTVDEMRKYILTRLGQPVINVEVATEQLDLIIYDSIQDFQRYNYGDGTYLKNTTLLVSPGVSEYYTGECGIEAAYDIYLSTGMGGINTLFSPAHVLLYDEWVTNGNYPGGPGTGYNFGTGALTNYEITGEYMALAEQMLGKQYTVYYNSGEKKLVVTPTPQSCMVATLKLYYRTKAEELYNHPLVKKLCVARARIQWGINTTKYNVQLPDGSTLNTATMLDHAFQEEEKVMEDIRWQSAPCDLFIG